MTGGENTKKRIQINHLGYMTDMPKTAVCRVTAGVFYLVDAAKGISVYAGRLSAPFFDRLSGDTVRLADFSDFNVRGTYFIRAGYRRSDVFEISSVPYKNVRQTILGGIHLNRCGYDFTGKPMVPPAYRRRECHTEPAVKNGRPADASGGWHTGGDYGKNTEIACLVAADMLYALRLFKESFSDNERLNVENECRWGLEWLLKMQDRDGSVHMGVSGGGEDVLPEEDVSEYRFMQASCRAELVFTAAAALGADYFKKTDKSFARKLCMAAEKSWLAALRTGEYEDYTSKLGSADENGESLNFLESRFMWAMCEMYALTGEESFERMIVEKYILSSFTGFGYDSCGGFAALSYLMNDRQRDRAAVAFIRKRLTDKADLMKIKCARSGYRIARNTGNGFVKGSNFGIISDCMDFIVAYLISGERSFLCAATDQFSYIFGMNPMGTAYMTGCGGDSTENPYHRLSTLNEFDPAIPGMIVDGANLQRSDEYSKWHIEKNTPPAKCYADNSCCSCANEPRLHYSAPIIFISAFYDKVGRSAISGH